MPVNRTAGGGAGRNPRPPVYAKTGQQPARPGIEGIDPKIRAKKNPRRIVPVPWPIDEPAPRRRVFQADALGRLESKTPALGSSGGIQGDDGTAWSRGVEHPIDDNGSALDIRGSVLGVVGPRPGEAMNVSPRDLV